MNLSFDKADIQENKNTIDPNKPRVMKTGIYEVVTTELKSGVGTGEKKSPYIDWTVTNRDKEILTHRYYTSEASWPITSSNFLQLVVAITGSGKDEARDLLQQMISTATDNADFTKKLSSLVVGKPFNLKVNGEETIIATSGTKFIKSKFGNNFTFALGIKDDIKKMGKIYIKTLPTSTSNLVNQEVESNDLLF